VGGAAQACASWSRAPPDEAAAANDACLALGELAGEPDRSLVGVAGAALTVVRDYRIGALADVAGLRRPVPRARGVAGATSPSRWRTGASARRLDVLRHGYALQLRAAAGAVPVLRAVAAGRGRVPLRGRALAAAVRRSWPAPRDGWAHYYTGVVAPVSVALAMCASVLGRHDEAVALAERGVVQTQKAGFTSLLLVQEVDLAQVLRRRGAPGDRRRVVELCEDLAARADALGCAGTAAYARRLAAQA
jgi:hypothetical protein